MNLLDILDHKHFLVNLFPEGLDKNLMIGQVNFDFLGNTTVSLHTRQQPAIEVKKWGRWGVRYNVIVVKISSSIVKKFSAKNISGALYAKVDVQQVENGIRLTQRADDWSFDLVCGYLMFDSCSVYLDEHD
ncbi:MULTISPECIES: hypothetical protein [Pseudomonas]|uniref:Immunity protein 50 n=1 Tax=Pseudomonas quercus TaxID=2722792 RepID=A0ABX0YGC8_9PSED|nr:MULTISPECIES: hypothetical protein [Pseudomonas]MBF7142703.1 hypothetical protein [Pseudomonas sp. LY10J]NJP01241.1 hypothetical protein [Pseudomonas quercus]